VEGTGVKNMLQLIHVATIGGAEKHTRLIIKAFARRGLNITFVYPPGAYASEFAGLSRYGVECIEYDLKKGGWESIRFVRRLLRERNIGVMHSHMHGADFIAAFARIGLKGVRHFSTIHNVPQDNPGTLFRIKSTVMTLMAFHLADKVFAVSAPVARRMRREMLLPGSKVATTLNSIDFEEMNPEPAAVNRLRRELKHDEKTRLIMCVGILFWVKGQTYLIQALDLLRDQYPNIKLVLLGRGHDEAQIRSLVDQLDLQDRVVFAGYQLNVPDWLSVADVYAQPSMFDPLPRALLEAMYMGLPVVASDLDTIRQIVTHGESGLVAERKSAAALADAIGYMLDNPDHARAMGDAAREFVTKNCSIDNMARAILDSMNVV
jgi:glycosyltransferase involved in cell wall biosynthesis